MTTIEGLEAHDELRKEITNLRAENALLQIEVASLRTAQPGAEQNLYFQLQAVKAKLAEQESYGREYIAKTDPLTSCADDPENGTCGECRECYWVEIKRKSAEIEKLIRDNDALKAENIQLKNNWQITLNNLALADRYIDDLIRKLKARYTST